MSYSPESIPPHKRLAYTHALIAGHRDGNVTYLVARQAIEAAYALPKGQRSGFEMALERAALSKANIGHFATAFAARALEYRDDPFKLRAGGESHWYVDAREGLGTGPMLGAASRLMIAHANVCHTQREVVSGMGIAGTALVTGIGLSDPKVKMSWGNDSHNPDQRYGYGLHGAKVEGSQVWIVDDTATTGDSLITLAQMIREYGGIVERADVLVDRSQGRAAAVMRELGIGFGAVLQFNEDAGQVESAVPNRLLRSYRSEQEAA